MSDETVFVENANFGIGLPDSYLLIISLAGFGFLCYTLFRVLVIRLKTRDELEKEEMKNSADYEARLVRADVNGLCRAERRARARAIMKQQRRIQPERRIDEQAQEGEGDVLHVVEPVGEPEIAGDESEPLGPHLSRKERLRKAKAAEKEERTMMQEERQKNQQVVEQNAQQLRRDRAKRQIVELETERRKQRLLREENEQKLFLEQKTFLSTHTSSLMVHEWIEELQSIRSVSIDDMASRFEVPSERVVGRMKELIKQRRVSGIITASGRFVYFSEDEVERIAGRLTQKDVVHRADLADTCNSIVLGLNG